MTLVQVQGWGVTGRLAGLLFRLLTILGFECELQVLLVDGREVVPTQHKHLYLELKP